MNINNIDYEWLVEKTEAHVAEYSEVHPYWGICNILGMLNITHDAKMNSEVLKIIDVLCTISPKIKYVRTRYRHIEDILKPKDYVN